MLNPLDLTNRRVLVTGASSGIGRATAVLLSQLGATVILVARNSRRLECTLGELQGAGHVVRPYDLREFAGIPRWMKEGMASYGPLDACVHCAGVQTTRPLQYVSDELIKEMMDVNLMATLAISKGFRQRDVHASPASLVYVSSIAGIIGLAGQAVYGATKAALVNVARSLAVELAPESIRVNCIAPGYVENTQMTDQAEARTPPGTIDKLRAAHPLGTGTALDVAYAAAYLVSGMSRWITGTTLIVDGGYTAQ